MLALATLACFTPAATSPDWSKQDFENDHTTNDSLVLQPFAYDDLYCPDGEPATFFAIYDESLTTSPLPVVVVFHSGSFDYVKVPDPQDPLAGSHYAAENRMTADWAADKVFETFGLLPGDQVDSSEVNSGTIPAALAEAGMFALYPANCWGDLWHNETGDKPNDVGADGGLSREGRFLAWAMTRFSSTDATDSAAWRSRYGLDELPVTLDSGGVYMVGLGEGGRAVPELIHRALGATSPPTNVNGGIVDSTCDDLSYYRSNASTNEAYYTGLERIFSDDDLPGLQTFSLYSQANSNDLTFPVQVYYSGGDPLVPDECLTPLVSLEGTNQYISTVVNMQTTTHVQLNDDIKSARDVVNQMLGL